MARVQRSVYVMAGTQSATKNDSDSENDNKQ